MKWLLMFDPLAGTFEVEATVAVLERNYNREPPTAPPAYPIGGGESYIEVERIADFHRKAVRRKTEAKNQAGET